MSVLFSAIAAGGCTSTGDKAIDPPREALFREEGAVYSVRLGQFEIYLLVDSARGGNAGILINAEDAVSKYIPQSGFNHSTNAVLLKTPEGNILIDTAFGAGVSEGLRKIGLENEHIDAILITHLHGDHIGWLQRDGKAIFPNASIYISEKELEYFTVTNVNQGAVTALAPYSGKVNTFNPGRLGENGNELFRGITPIAAYGHTPGHTIYLLESGGEKFLVIGDLLHVALVQFPVPEISATYDMDPAASGVLRRQVLDYAAKNNVLVGGMHMVYPGIGSVEADGTGFRFIPGE